MEKRVYIYQQKNWRRPASNTELKPILIMRVLINFCYFELVVEKKGKLVRRFCINSLTHLKISNGVYSPTLASRNSRTFIVIKSEKRKSHVYRPSPAGKIQFPKWIQTFLRIYIRQGYRCTDVKMYS